MATSQRAVDIPEGEPFICPRCSSDLAPVIVRKSSGRLRGVQIAAVVIGVAGLGGKVYLDNRPHPAAPPPVQAASVQPESIRSIPVERTAAFVPATVALPAAPARATVTPFLKLADGDGAGSRLAAAYLALSGDTDIHSQVGSQPGSTEFVGTAAGRVDSIEVLHASTQAARTALAQGDADLALVVAAPGEPTFATFAAAVIVNPGNHIASLTRAQLQAVFSGKVRNWSELGAPPGDIHAFIADPHGMSNSAAGLFGDATQPNSATNAADDAAVLIAVTNDSDSIGLVAAAAAGAGHTIPVTPDNATPAVQSGAALDTGAHGLNARMTLLAGDTPSPAAARFLAYATSAVGRIAIENAGLLPAGPVAPVPAALPATVAAAAAVPIAPVSPDRFKRYVAGATLLPVVFHFEPGSTLLDRGGLHDVDRLTAYLRAHRIGGDKLLLAGFSDNTGAQAVREVASQKRVAAVAAALARADVTPARAAGFGADVAVADDATEEGRDRNRRVEVYFQP